MSAYKDAKKNTWYAKFRYKGWMDDTKWVTKRGFSTKREALQWERDFLAQKSGSTEMIFRDFVDVYLKDRTPRLKESTTAMKENVIETKLVPYFGKLPLRDITSKEVIQWQNEMLRYRDPESHRPYSKTYLKTVHNQLSAIFNHAVRFYGLRENPARLAGNMGSERCHEMKYWIREEYQEFSEAVMDDPVAYYCFEVLYWCGIREGELLALTPEDINLESKTLTVSKTFQRVKGRDLITEPKTPKSNRKVSMPDFLCEELEDYMKSCYGLEMQDRLFPVTKSFLYRAMERGCRSSGVKRIRVHDLRHSHVSLLIDMGFSALAIADRMGHECIDITYRYAHLFPNVQTQMADKLNGLREVADDV